MVKVLKFGGASIKDVDSIKNVVSIIQSFKNQKLVIVFSAIANVTNMLEKVVDEYVKKDSDPFFTLNKIKEFHHNILINLFEKEHIIFDTINNLFLEVEWVLEEEYNNEYSYNYDQIVSIGELLSTNILSAYLNLNNFSNNLIDARDFIKTNNQYQSAKINWLLTEKYVREKVIDFPVITQGFIGCTSENFTTTLGREGSDFTAAVLANILDAENVIIWKDVDGVLNADPRYFSDTKLIKQLSFTDAIELAYYGAKVIHPKTIQPLKEKKIPLYVKSFKKINKSGTVINSESCKNRKPSYIVKENQVLISISDVDLSFIIEEHLSYIFMLLSKFNITINLMQNSAVSFSICVDNHNYKIPLLIEEISKKFSVYYNTDLNLYTIRYYDDESISKVINDKKIFLEQKSRNTVQFITS
jgi:aspartate kinase